MRTLAAAFAVSLFAHVPASAQSFDQSYGSFNWTRFYAGPFASFGFGQSTFTPPTTPATTFGTAGFGGGLVVGNTYDFNSFVVGGELDAQAGGLTGTTTCPGTTDACQTSISWMATLRGKAGIATPIGLIYGTVGPALAGVDVKVTPSGGVAKSVSQTRLGYAAGLGFEMPISDKVTLGAEYVYADFWKFEESGTLAAGKTTATAPMHAIRAGARFSF